MRAWKNIALVFGLSLSAGLLGAACSVTDEDPAAAPEVTEAQEAEASDVAGQSEATGSADQSIGLDHGHFGDRERRCREHCEDRRRGCERAAHGQRERRRCINQFEGCRDHCRDNH